MARRPSLTEAGITRPSQALPPPPPAIETSRRAPARQGKRKWRWIALTACADLACLIVAFYVSGWVSVTASAAFIVLTTFTGYKAFQLVRWEKLF